MASAQSSAATVTPHEVKDLLDAGERVLLVDVREPDEFADWHIPGAVNLPLGELLGGADVPAEEGQEVVTVCFSGMRSERARQVLAARGGAAVRNLAGGMVAWNSVYDVVRVPDVAVAGVEVLQFRRVGKGCLSYMLLGSGEATVIDATLDVDAFQRVADEHGARIARVLDTHAHADHVSGGARLAAAAGAPYHAPDEVEETPHEAVRDGMAFPVGGARLEVLEAPGHTPGSVLYRLGGLLFTGDTLFVESVGRPDLGQDPRPNARTLWRTLHERILALPGDTRILPAHYGDDVTLRRDAPVSERLADLRQKVPALRMEEEAFADWAAANALPKPGNFQTVKKVNQGRVRIDDPDELRQLEAGPNRCAVKG